MTGLYIYIYIYIYIYMKFCAPQNGRKNVDVSLASVSFPWNLTAFQVIKLSVFGNKKELQIVEKNC